MRNNETGEFELVVGNRQLLSGFFIVVLLFAVAFAMGYVVGQNSPRSVRMASETPPTSVPAPNTEVRPQPLSPVTPAVTPPAETPAATGTGPQPSTQPAQGSPSTEAAPVSEAPAAVAGNDLPAGSYWQVMAVREADADSVKQTLKDKGFPVVLTPGTNNLTRVLVGPYTDAQAFGRAKTELENAGVHPMRFRP